ncbi:phosphomannomutase/phosphoglucomutase [Methyloglobulus morosus KoM1]|uniref:phosphomannomutase n=2 Tax=Methyloglobulus TaxID=1410680 RepID=V5DRW4_9GAMM|nr:phosphomannomutase/phosphoglucomutase [Methyloglobulus morosus KoM1]
MERLFLTLTCVALLMILIAGTGVYLSSKVVVAKAKDDAALSSAKGASQALTEQIKLLDAALDKMARDPDVIAAVTSTNPAALKTVAAKLEQHYPITGKLRLIPVGTIEADQVNVPRMGFGDIDMIKATFQENPLPEIQGDVGPDRHLAITHKIMRGNQVVGVILASLSFDFINQSLQDAGIESGYMEIRQGKLSLSSVGDKNDVDGGDLKQLKVSGTSWELYYLDPKGGILGQGAVIFSFIFIPLLIALSAFYITYRQFSVTLAQDLDRILQAFQDILSNRPKGSYPVTLMGMNALIASMVRYNREINQRGEKVRKNAVDDFELEGYFEDMGMPSSQLAGNVAATQPPANPATKVKQQEPTPETPKIDIPELTGIPQEIPQKDDPSAAIFRAYDIRGIVGQTLTKEIVYNIGRAVGSEAKELGCHTVVIGRDGRISSPTLAEALSNGVVSTGCNVLDIGMVPTPVLYFVVQHTDGRSGVMITGSHNPSEYNGLKMMIKGNTLAGDRIQELKKRIDNHAFVSGKGSIEQNGMFESEYIGTLCDDIQVARPMKIVLDCGNGVAGELAPVLFKNLGCEVIELFCEVDGNFPNHHPDPSKPENLAELISTVKHYGADLGIAFDGDGDRLGVVDSKGKIIWPDRQMMLFAKDVLAGKPGSEIIYDVKCSRHLPDQIVKYGGRPLMWKTGHSFMKAKLKETGAKLAGEMSGHIFFNDRWFGFDDALYSAARLLQILSEDPRPSSEVFADFPDSINTPELNVELAEGENVKFIKGMFAAAQFTGGKITDIDGMRIDFSDGWGLVRASNTTPSLVIRFEADSKVALENIQAQFRDLMRTVKPGIKLPF